MTYEDYRAILFDAPAADRVDDGFLPHHTGIVNCEYDTLGIRTPFVKKLAKSVPLAERDQVLDGFFKDGERVYETMLFASCVAAKKGDYAATLGYLKRLIPLFGSWAHVDTVIPLLRWTDADTALRDLKYLIDGGRYERRFYLVYLMAMCLDDGHIDYTLDTVKSMEYGEYYVDMAAAWLVAEALVKQYDKAVAVIEQKTLPAFVHNKAIQKARESFRISDEKKAYLNTLKIR